MPDAFADSTARLEQLLQQVKTETDPVKVDEIGAEIWSVLRERDRLRGLQKASDEP